MHIYYKSKKLDFSSGGEPIIVIRQKEAENLGIQPGDRVILKWSKVKNVTAVVQYTNSKVDYSEVGLFKEIWQKNKIEDEDIVKIKLYSRPKSIKAINKKLLGKALSYDEIKSIIIDISNNKIGNIEITYFVASGFANPFSATELFYMTKAMAETGDRINLRASAVDKHCIGGVPANRTTMIVVPIIASLGLYIPKTSSRAITAPSGTADTMEVLAPVSLTLDRIKEVVRKTHGCIAWGGALNMAPADDKIIKVEKPLSLETYDKMIVSIMAKHVAVGADYLLIDIPYGPTAKVHDIKTAQKIAKQFIAIGKKFKIKVRPIITKGNQPIGAGIGPALEARDVLRVLQQHDLRPRDLEKKSAILAGEILELKKYCRRGMGKKIAMEQIKNGQAWKKMNQIIVAQGGKKNLKADEVALGALRYEIHAKSNGKVITIDNKAIKEISVNLGAPREKLAGIHMHCQIGDKIFKGQKLYTLYAQTENRLKLGRLAAKHNRVVAIS